MQRNDRFEQARRRARFQTLAMLTAALAGALAYPMLARAAPAPGSAAPDFALKGIDGKNLRLSEYRGDTVVLSFWASWCGPCREALLQLNSVAAGQGAAGAPVVLGVNLGDDPDRAASVAGSMHLNFPTLVDTKQAVGRLYDVDKLPLTLLVDADGRVRGAWAGDANPVPELTRQIKELQSR
ncbi:MAG TPA: TlpA disulfide reductase family protein [Steroidobacteraceae bacterium]